MKLHRSVCVERHGAMPARPYLDTSMTEDNDASMTEDNDVVMVDVSDVEIPSEPSAPVSGVESVLRQTPKAWRGSYIPRNRELVTNPLLWMKEVGEPRSQEPLVQ